MRLLLSESRRDDYLLPYVNLLREKGINTNVSQLKQFLLKKFTNEAYIRNLSLDSNFYLVGVARYYFNGDLTKNKVLNVFDENQTDVFHEDICTALNACILVLRNAYIDSIGTQFEQPEDFGELSLPKLLRKYNKKINEVLGKVTPKKKENVEEPEGPIDTNVGNGYTFDIIYSHEQAQQYKKFTEPGAWCITYSAENYNMYIRRYKCHYVFLLQNGYENVPRKMGKNFTKAKPQDEYGNSMIALLQSNSSPEPVLITSRWNHGSYQDGTIGTEADHAYTKEELFAVTGMNDADLKRIYDIWEKNRDKKKKKDNTEKNKNKANVIRQLKYAQMKMNGGENIYDIFRGRITGKLMMGKFETMKDFRKVICSLVITFDEGRVFILCDKGKMNFDTLYYTEDDNEYIENFAHSSFNKEDEYYNGARRFNNLVRINYPTYTMLYDTRFKRLIDIDGVKKFKYMGTYPDSWNEPVFFEVCQSSTQRALIDIETNKPLRLPNGAYWYYDLKHLNTNRFSYNEVDPIIVYKKDACLILNYDASAGINFYYDIASKRFFQPQTYEEYPHVSLLTYLKLGNKIMFGYSKSRWGTDFVVPYENGEPTEMAGHSMFKNIKAVNYEAYNTKNVLSNNRYAEITTTKGNIVLYDYRDDKEYVLRDYEGYPINVKQIQDNKSFGCKNEDGDDPYCWVTMNNFVYHQKMLYDLINHRFMLNPVTKSYIFDTYSDVFKIRDGLEIYTVPYTIVKYLQSKRIMTDKNYQLLDRTYVTIDEVIEYTDANADKIGAAPQSDEEYEEQFWASHKNLRIEESKKSLSENDMKYIINQTMKILKK